MCTMLIKSYENGKNPPSVIIHNIKIVNILGAIKMIACLLLLALSCQPNESVGNAHSENSSSQTF